MGETNFNESERRIQWHEAFVAAMKLELKEYAEYITFWSEYELTGRPKYIDMVMIKDKGIANEGFAYVGMYIYECGNNKSIKIMNSTNSSNSTEYATDKKTDLDVLAEFQDTTLVFIRKAKQVKLFGQLKNKKCHIEKTEEGVYTINVRQLFRVQIIVTREISFDKHPWLCALTRKLDEQQAGMLIELEKQSRTNWEYVNAEDVMDVVMSANRKVFESVIGGNDNMCSTI